MRKQVSILQEVLGEWLLVMNYQQSRPSRNIESHFGSMTNNIKNASPPRSLRLIFFKNGLIFYIDKDED